MRNSRKSDVLIGSGEWIKNLFEQMHMVAPTDATVAIYGESGTGKELVARTVHQLSRRHGMPFVMVNCSAIPAAQLGRELFGGAGGAPLNRDEGQETLFSRAHGGTLYLDNIGEISDALQERLLRVFEAGGGGGAEDDPPDLLSPRIICAADQKLPVLVAAGKFRKELFCRLSVITIELPPLRARRADIPLLANHFLNAYRGRVGQEVVGFSSSALEKLSAYDFPGNVRELESQVHRAMVLTQGSLIDGDDLRFNGAPVLGGTHVDVDHSYRDQKRAIVEDFERRYLDKLLSVFGGNIARAADSAGMDRKNLWLLLRKHGINPDGYRS